MANRRIVTTLGIFVALLILVVPAITPLATKEAYAQTSTSTSQYGRLVQVMRLNYSDGTASTVTDTRYFAPTTTADIAGANGKTVKSVTVSLTAQLPNPADTITYSGVSLTAMALKPDGTYVNIPISPTVSDYNIQKTASGAYTLYQADIPVSAIQSAIGNNVPANFQSEIRVTSGLNSAVYGTIGGATMGLYVTQTFTSFSIIVNPSGSTVATSNTVVNSADTTSNSGALTSAPTAAVPHGKIYHVFSLKYKDGHSRSVVNENLKTFDIVTPNDPTEGSNLIDSVTYRMWLVLDNDVFALPNKVTFANMASTDNFGVTVAGKNIAKTYDDVVQRVGPQIQLLKIDVKGSDIQQALNGGSGSLDINVAPYTLTLQSPGKTFPISVNAQHVSLNLITADMSGDTGGTVDNTDFKPTGSSGFGLGLNNQTLMIIGGALGVAIIGFGLAKKNKRRKIRR